MAIQTVNLGTAPTGAGGDTFRSTGAKINENFTNWSHAASRYVGTSAGNVMEVGAFGFGGMGVTYSTVNTLSDVKNIVQNQSRIFRADGGSVFQLYAPTLYMKAQDTNVAISFGPFSGDVKAAGWTDGSSDFTAKYFFRTSSNTTVDANGFLKNASPVVKLFADKIEPNEEAAEQPLSFEKLDVGHYLVKGSSGFAKEGWWIEIPTDTHGNKICAVEYQTLENGDLEIKTFKKKLNDEGDIVANLDAPIDIPNNANGEPRWIDIRLNSIKKTIVRKIPRTEKQPRMVQQVKYAPQLTYITKYEDLFDDEGKAVIVDGKNYKKPVTHIQTDQNGTPILSNQPVINENGEPVFEWVQAVDSEGNPVFDDVPVLDKDGNPMYDEVTYDPE
ncbi:hypothetical protein GD578_06280 [Acinetobacter nosocomialis]|uniref:Phage tail protein C-terminal domain-containing protein n=1 Tax=Acinetobacter nosocomialis TaxID=106654 RepID=A0AB37CTN7_ACINO|nr:hypothetical protein [Acinetobacter nosocomialis]QGA43489.1 hypothetical protein GD578_06280 [Acinetobacter nosocomialis]